MKFDNSLNKKESISFLTLDTEKYLFKVAGSLAPACKRSILNFMKTHKISAEDMQKNGEFYKKDNIFVAQTTFFYQEDLIFTINYSFTIKGSMVIDIQSKY